MTKNWVDQYADWAMQRSPLTPKHFHENIGLALIAGAVAGRCFVQLPHEKVYPNMYTLVIATTSVYAKTTAFNIAQEVIDLAFPDKVLYGVLTPEAMLTELSGTKPTNFASMTKQMQDNWMASAQWGARRLFVADEAGRFFNSLHRDYNIGLDALMMELYDASERPISRNTMKNGYISVERPALSCLFGTTPANVHELLSKMESWASGFWARWNFVTETTPTPFVDSAFVPAPPKIVQPIKEISDGWLNQYNAKAYSIPIADSKVKQVYRDYTQQVRAQIIITDDERMHGALSRLPTRQLKAALLFCIVECAGKNPKLSITHWDMAQPIAERWHQDALKTVETAGKTERITLESKVEMLIKSYAKTGISSREMQQRTGKSAQDVQSILDIFARDGTAEKRNGGGKSIKWYPC